MKLDKIVSQMLKFFGENDRYGRPRSKFLTEFSNKDIVRFIKMVNHNEDAAIELLKWAKRNYKSREDINEEVIKTVRDQLKVKEVMES
jgi:hypothetical protein